jgi:hypothetical protein
MNKIFYFIVFLTSLPVALFGQADSIKNEIMSYSIQKPVIIAKGRKFLLDKLIQKDYKKVREIRDYLRYKIENIDNLAFTPREYLLIAYWTKEYDEIINNINVINFNTSALSIRPPDDQLFEKIREHSWISIELLGSFIDDSWLGRVDKDFLKLNLRFLITDNDYPQINDKYLISQANQFLELYPQSNFESFIRYNIKVTKFASDWEWGAQSFSGYGMFTGNLSKIFTNIIPIGFTIDGAYKNLVFNMRLYPGFFKTKIDIPYESGVWNRGSKVRIIIPELSAGYIVSNNEDLKIAIFIGIGLSDIMPSENDVNKNPDLENAELKFSTTYTLGLNYDIKLGPAVKVKEGANLVERYFIIRIGYEYYFPQFQWKYDGFNGGIQSLTLGFGMFDRKIYQ